eukprot:CAMPEP_0185018350 /NCGR_PEP_ID=MMETSP1103-20130426/1104_1 /TAXON_ID=36769 /ORGANISM="Paraphysomonas bandaiensis, Strain Caron Lab Isolate" /LENGTH=115 /DNA_ID=CAMNT_0027548137 /DNA_START=575 /DNA_END=922 /DNA_ORIENTATION=+
MMPETSTTDKTGFWYEESALGLNCEDHKNYIYAYYVGESPVQIECHADGTGSRSVRCDGSTQRYGTYQFATSDCTGDSTFIAYTEPGCHEDEPDEDDHTYQKTENYFCVPPTMTA